MTEVYDIEIPWLAMGILPVKLGFRVKVTSNDVENFEWESPCVEISGELYPVTDMPGEELERMEEVIIRELYKCSAHVPSDMED